MEIRLTTNLQRSYVIQRKIPVTPGCTTSHFLGRPGFLFLLGESGDRFDVAETREETVDPNEI